MNVPRAFAQVGKLGAGVGKLLVGGGATLVQVGLRLSTLLAALGHAVDVILLDSKDHIGLVLGRIQACRRIDRQLLNARLLALIADFLDIGFDFVDLVRVGIRIGVEILCALDDHVNCGVGR